MVVVVVVVGSGFIVVVGGAVVVVVVTSSLGVNVIQTPRLDGQPSSINEAETVPSPRTVTEPTKGLSSLIKPQVLGPLQGEGGSK